MKKDETEAGAKIADVKEKRNAYRMLVRKSDEKRAPGRTMCRWMKISFKYLN
jgi:hypothetical protein